MQLLTLTLENFRSYDTLSLDLENDQKVSVLIGENATGKTNVLEAVHVLALLKSSRKAGDADLIQWEQSHYRVTGFCRTDAGEEMTLEVVSQIEPKKSRRALINDVKKSAQQYIGTLPIITFTPDDLLLWSGSPGNRRRLIDTLLCQVSPTYLQALSEYEKTIKQRNILLKQIREQVQKPHSLDVWDEKIATLGAVITVDRLQLFETLQMTILRELSSLGERPRSANFFYVRKTESDTESTIRNEIIDQLMHYRERDILTLTTTTGPHRDDWTLSIDNHDVASFASRGQQRAALIALLLLQASFLELRKDEKPILLLDDVFSEFDEKHRSALLDTLRDHQVIMSAIEMDAGLRDRVHVMPCPMIG